MAAVAVVRHVCPDGHRAIGTGALYTDGASVFVLTASHVVFGSVAPDKVVPHLAGNNSINLGRCCVGCEPDHHSLLSHHTTVSYLAHLPYLVPLTSRIPQQLFMTPLRIADVAFVGKGESNNADIALLKFPAEEKFEGHAAADGTWNVPVLQKNTYQDLCMALVRDSVIDKKKIKIRMYSRSGVHTGSIVSAESGSTALIEFDQPIGHGDSGSSILAEVPTERRLALGHDISDADVPCVLFGVLVEGHLGAKIKHAGKDMYGKHSPLSTVSQVHTGVGNTSILLHGPVAEAIQSLRDATHLRCATCRPSRAAMQRVSESTAT